MLKAYTRDGAPITDAEYTKLCDEASNLAREIQGDDSQATFCFESEEIYTDAGEPQPEWSLRWIGKGFDLRQTVIDGLTKALLRVLGQGQHRLTCEGFSCEFIVRKAV